MIDEGVIKYACHWQPCDPFQGAQVEMLGQWRDRLYTAGLIGAYPEGVGYGNISLRLNDGTFLISGTQTGHLTYTNPHHYTLVDRWDIEANCLHCTGPVRASSESLTHAALYEYDSTIRAIVHGHHPRLWTHYHQVLPTTRANVPYGTPAMAHEMWRLFRESDNLPQQQVLVMGGHEDGILAFGSSLETAAPRLLNLLKTLES